MTKHVITGSTDSNDGYIREYIAKHQFSSYEIERFEGSIKIEHARAVKHSLSLKTTTQRLIIFEGAVTIEAQNALLKTLEELGDNVHFLFLVGNENELLPTILSRCEVVHISSNHDGNQELSALLTTLTTNKKNWVIIEEIIERISQASIDMLLPSLRLLLLQSVDQNGEIDTYYSYCRSMLSLLPLTRNNVSEKIIVESILM